MRLDDYAGRHVWQEPLETEWVIEEAPAAEITTPPAPAAEPPSAWLTDLPPAPLAPASPPAAPAPYVGEPPVSAEWLAARETALSEIRTDYGAELASAQAAVGQAPGWVEASTTRDESGGEVSTSGRSLVWQDDPSVPPPIVGWDEGGPIYGRSGRWLEFDEAAFAAWYRGSSRPAFESLDELYATPGVVQRHPELLDLALSDHALNAGPAPAGVAMGDPAQLGMLDLYLADSQISALISAYGGSVPPASSPLALEQVRLYGQERYAQLTRLSNAMASVRDQYTQAMAEAQASGGIGWVERPRMVTDESGVQRPMMSWDEGGGSTPVVERVFDPDAFTRWYLAQGGLQHQAFAAFYGQSHTSYTTDESGRTVAGSITFDNPNWQMWGPGGAMGHRELVSLDLNHAPRLNDDRGVGFDLEAGWATHHSNIHQKRDWFETVVQVAIVAGVGYLTAGAASAWAASASLGATASAVVVGAAAGAASSLASGAMSGNLTFKGVLQGALAGGLTGGLMAEYGAVAREVAGNAGVLALRTTVQGGIQALLGGEFKDGALAGFATGLADLAGASINERITEAVKNGTMSVAEAANAQNFARVLGSAIRAAGNPDDPLAGFASAFLSDVLRETDPAGFHNPTAPAAPGPAFDDEGHLMPGVVDAAAPPAVQALQLARQLEAQGMNPDQAAALAMAQLAPPRTTTPTPGFDEGWPEPDFTLPTVVITGQALPRDALGNRYETDSQGNQVVHLAGGGMLALSAAAAIPLSGNVAIPGMAALSRLAAAAGALASGALLWAVPGNAMQGPHSTALTEDLRFERRPGELYGTVYDRQGDGQWVPREERYAGFDTAQGFMVLSDEEMAWMRQPMTTPADPQQPPAVPPLPAWAQTPDPLPGFGAGVAPPPVDLEGYPAQQMRLDDLIIESRGLASGTPEHKAAAWDLYNSRPNDAWDYDRWSLTYEQNQVRAQQARAAELEYMRQQGWGTSQGSVDLLIDGQPTTRRLDIIDREGSRGVEVKTGYQSATVDNLWELRRDAALVAEGWKIEWVFVDTRPSQPLIDQLEAAGITVKIGLRP